MFGAVRPRRRTGVVLCWSRGGRLDCEHWSWRVSRGVPLGPLGDAGADLAQRGEPAPGVVPAPGGVRWRGGAGVFGAVEGSGSPGGELFTTR